MPTKRPMPTPEEVLRIGTDSGGASVFKDRQTSAKAARISGKQEIKPGGKLTRASIAKAASRIKRPSTAANFAALALTPGPVGPIVRIGSLALAAITDPENKAKKKK